jgi:hypothetical protein
MVNLGAELVDLVKYRLHLLKRGLDISPVVEPELKLGHIVFLVFEVLDLLKPLMLKGEYDHRLNDV